MTIAEARNICKAIHFFEVGCSKATAENPDGINEANLENMQMFGVSPDEVHRMVEFRVWLNAEADDLDSENEEMERFERANNKN
jgi:hypothetical protein